MTVAVKRRRGDFSVPTASVRSTAVELPVEEAIAVTPRSVLVLKRGCRPACDSRTATPTAASTTHAATTPPAIAACEALEGDEAAGPPFVSGTLKAAAATVPPGRYCAAATSRPAYAGTAASGPPATAAVYK